MKIGEIMATKSDIVLFTFTFISFTAPQLSSASVFKWVFVYGEASTEMVPPQETKRYIICKRTRKVS